MKNYYKALGVDPSSDARVIKQAYRGLVKKYHPDQSPDNERFVEKFKEINIAYHILLDPIKRQEHDNQLQKRIKGRTGYVFFLGLTLVYLIILITIYIKSEDINDYLVSKNLGDSILAYLVFAGPPSMYSLATLILKILDHDHVTIRRYGKMQMRLTILPSAICLVLQSLQYIFKTGPLGIVFAPIVILTSLLSTIPMFLIGPIVISLIVRGILIYRGPKANY